jgi:hypothetical protein
VYSLGVVLDELLDPPRPDLVARCCAASPDERPTAAEVAAALGPAPTVVIRRRRGRPVRPVEILLAVAALAAIVAAVILVLPDRRRPPTKVVPVPHSANVSREARNLQSWLERYSK